MPVREIDTVPLPTKTEAGLADISAGAGLLIVKATLEDVPPPGAGLTTEIWPAPALAKSAAVDGCL